MLYPGIDETCRRDHFVAAVEANGSVMYLVYSRNVTYKGLMAILRSNLYTTLSEAYLMVYDGIAYSPLDKKWLMLRALYNKCSPSIYMLLASQP